MVGEANTNLILELLYVFQIFYILAPAAVKLSLILLYKRIFISPRCTLLFNVCTVFIILWATIMTFLAVFNCTPIRGFWTGEGTCFNFRSFAIGYAVVNITSDLVIWTLPIPLIWRMQLPLGQKVAVTLIFILGLL